MKRTVSFRSDDVIRSGDSVSVDFAVSDRVSVRQLEHVEVVANIEYPVRGALEVALVSPKGGYPRESYLYIHDFLLVYNRITVKPAPKYLRIINQ